MSLARAVGRFRGLAGPIFALVTVAFPATVSAAVNQWSVTELSFYAENDYRDPFDFEHVGFTAEFVGPESRTIVIPGFWDGDRVWRVRFTPPLPGKWEYVTRCRDQRDRGLHARRGSLTVAPPSGDTLLRRHGGFLRASANGRYLTYSDGTPFFWLGDTWWVVPSGLVSFDDFKRMVDRRVAHGFSIFQAHGYTGFGSNERMTVFDAIRDGGDAAIDLWQRVDEYIAYAELRGLVGVMGFAATDAIDRVSLPDLKRLWFYYLSRYAAYPITFLLTQEYNAEIGNKRDRVEKMLQLGRFIYENDPYKRAFSAHPWVQSKDGREAWKESWCGFLLLQSGHFVDASCESYLRAYASTPARPVVESETNYEGFLRKSSQVDAAVVRDSAYTAMQCGASGFTYGAQGLYAGITNKERPAATAKWGPVLTWDEGLALPGGAQLAHLRRLYETLEWWRLEPWPPGKATEGTLVRSVGHDVIVAYLPSANLRRGEVGITGLSEAVRYRAEWFDPRTGVFSPISDPLTVDRGALRVPRAPSAEDWLFVAHVVRRGEP